MKKWIYVGYTRAHTHDVRALAVAVPISREGVSITSIVSWFLCYFFFQSDLSFSVSFVTSF